MRKFIYVLLFMVLSVSLFAQPKTSTLIRRAELGDSTAALRTFINLLGPTDSTTFRAYSNSLYLYKTDTTSTLAMQWELDGKLSDSTYIAYRYKNNNFAAQTFADTGNSFAISSGTNILTLSSGSSVGTPNQAIFYISTGDGSNSSDSAYVTYLSNSMSFQQWDVGLYGTKNYRIHNTTLGSSALSIDYTNNNVTIGGTATMTGFKLTAATTTGYVLTTDASGTGTWQASSGSGGGYTPDGITIIGNADSTLTADMFLDIRSFGADTASADNSTALQNAIDSARVRGKALYIPSGTFKFTTGLIDTVSGLTIYGESKRTSVLKYTGTGDALTIGTGTNFALGTYSTSIFNLTLKGQAGAHNGIMLQNGNEVNINNCIISFFDNGMAQGVDTWTNNFIKVDFMDNDSSGIKITGVFNLSNFTNCSWRRNGGDGIYITSAGRPFGITITASTFETNGDHGIQSDYALQYFTLEGGWFEGNSGISIYGTDLYSATISNCNFSDIHAYDIFFNNVLGGTKIFGNTGILATTAFLGVTGGSILNSVIGPNKTYYAGGPAHHVYVYGTIYDQDVFNSTTIVMDGSHGAGYTTLTVRKKTGMGEVRLGSGDSTYTGTIEFYTPSETLTGYFGYTSSATIFPLTLSSGVTFWIYGGDGVHIDSSLIVGGSVKIGSNSVTIDSVVVNGDSVRTYYNSTGKWKADYIHNSFDSLLWILILSGMLITYLIKEKVWRNMKRSFLVFALFICLSGLSFGQVKDSTVVKPNLIIANELASIKKAKEQLIKQLDQVTTLENYLILLQKEGYEFIVADTTKLKK